MKKMMEKAAILSLSLLLVSTYSVSAALPAMLEHFSGYTRSSVEQLISITSFAIMIIIILNNWISRYLSERISIVIGVILMAVGGSTPVLIQRYEVIFAARVLLGIGIGLVNSHAINMINERYEGNERATLLGFRSSAEVLGNTILTLIAGQLLAYGWPKAFAIYLCGLPVLVLYLCFVTPKEKQAAVHSASEQKKSLSDAKTLADQKKSRSKAGTAKSQRENVHKGTVRDNIGELVQICGLGVLLICVNSSNTMRIPALTLERGLGTEADASVVLSLMMVTGIIAGICFGKLVQILKSRLQGISFLVLGLGMGIIACSGNMIVMALGAMITGIAYSVLVTAVFHRASTRLPQELMSLGTTCGLVGCNLGATLSPYALKLIGCFGEKMSLSFAVYAVLMLVLGCGAVFRGQRKI